MGEPSLRSAQFTPPRTIPQLPCGKGLADSDALVIHGGGVLTSATRSRLWEFALTAEIASSLGKRVLFRSHQLGPFNNNHDEERIKTILQCSRYVSTRDLDQSKREAGRIFSHKHIVDQVDDALLIHSNEVSEDGILSEHNLREGNFICVGYRDNPGVGTSDLAFSRIAKIVESAHEIFKCPVVLLPQGPFDLPALRHLSSMLSFDTQIIDPKDAFRDPIAIASHARLMIATPHHSLIFALRGGVPILSPVMGEYYSFKNIGSMKFFGLEDFVIDISTCGENYHKIAGEKLRFLRENETRIRQFLKSRVVALRAMAYSQDQTFAHHLLGGSGRALARRKIMAAVGGAKAMLLGARSLFWRLRIRRGL